ncbi:MAG: hemolysin family protein [Candidatus Diapherotrites archaeon]|nr:hemolysin family protein [Candidatus Micrarchaeota archaeon]MBU1939717.1 hemolysin family protein [Candidatus Micrarchaeota archaeon]
MMAFSIELNLMALLVLILLSAFFSSVETAFVSLNRLRVRKLVRSKARFAVLIEQLKARPHRLLITILVGNNFVNVAAAAVATNLALNIMGSEAQGTAIAIATGAMTFLLLVFGEITPKAIAIRNAEFICQIAAKPLHYLSIILTPVIWVLEKITGAIISITGEKQKVETVTEDEVRAMVAVGEEEGQIKRSEREMIQRIFKFNDIPVEDVMTPRTEIAAVEAGTKIEDLPKVLKGVQFSRIPVYKDDADRIVGILYSKDVKDCLLAGKKSCAVGKIMRPAVFVPPTKKIDKLLREFQNRHVHMAIVIDEYGGVLGLVTIEDLLEELVGEIIDETEDVPEIKQLDSRTYSVDGDVELGRLGKELQITLESEEFDTIGGYILNKLDRLPKRGEKIKLDNATITVTSMEGQRIEKVTIEKVPKIMK